jgi:uncharacterized LabA/DUF88 family protein
MGGAQAFRLAALETRQPRLETRITRLLFEREETRQAGLQLFAGGQDWTPVNKESRILADRRGAYRRMTATGEAVMLTGSLPMDAAHASGRRHLLSTSSTKLAVLIDADNARPTLVKELLDEIAKYGTAHVKRIYGDWTTPNLGGWKESLLGHSIQPIQQFRYTVGKNATDSAMIIDAMDLLYSGHLDGFCLVSSDSDFTRLAQRIRESGLVVYGFGERKTPEPFREACDKFIYVDVLAPVVDDKQEDANKRMGAKELRQNSRLMSLIRNAIEAASDDTGWASLGAVGSIITKQSTDFDSRNYGYAKLSSLIKAIGLFDCEERQIGNGKALVVRNKPKKGG